MLMRPAAQAGIRWTNKTMFDFPLTRNDVAEGSRGKDYLVSRSQHYALCVLRPEPCARWGVKRRSTSLPRAKTWLTSAALRCTRGRSADRLGARQIADDSPLSTDTVSDPV